MLLSQRFSSLAACMSSSNITGLYFASSWCPDCTPITPLLKKAYENEMNDGKFGVVYVSSDRNEDEMMKSFSNTHGSWGYVPFDNADRSELKRYFGTCAGKEVQELGISFSERKNGIPTLIIIDSKSEQILSYQGVHHLERGDFLQKFVVDMK